MDVVQDIIIAKRIKIFLIFFCLCCFESCEKDMSNLNFKVIYENEKAIALEFESQLVTDSLTVHANNSKVAILGNYKTLDNKIRFVPLLPFNQNKEYAIHYYGKELKFKTSTINTKIPKLLHIYPSCDTVPENLLKFYLVFSQPMQEVGNVLDFVKVKNTDSNIQDNVFLSLKTELWNKDHTQLTLWLDPGRIKTDLIPNNKKGLPLRKGNNYQLIIDKKWQDAQGIALDSTYTKKLYVTHKDTVTPKSVSWTITSPKSATKTPLLINFHESLDALLLLETITIVNSQKKPIKGIFELGNNEKSLSFSPSQPWGKGDYTIKIEGILEDLAANNLNAPF